MSDKKLTDYISKQEDLQRRFMLEKTKQGINAKVNYNLLSVEKIRKYLEK